MSSNNTPLKILLLTHRVPYPPDKGDRIRSYHLLTHLARRHRVFLAALADEPADETSQRVLSPLCEKLAVVPQSRLRWVRALLAMLTGSPVTHGFFHAPRLREQLTEWALQYQFDVVVGYCSGMAQYLVVPPLDRLPAVVDLVDVDSAKWLDYSHSTRGWRRWIYGLEARRLRRFESQLAEHCSALTVVTDREAAAYREFQPAGRVAVVSNGVDLEYFNHRAAAGTQETKSPGEGPLEADTASCIFIGALDYFPNVDGVGWFCEHVWPEVRKVHPVATLALVGRHPNRAMQRLGELPGVKVVGSVPDVRPYLRAAHVAIAPLRIARGVQNKVLEAMAMARPVVVSPQAAEGLPRNVADAAIVATTPRDWATQIGRLLESPALAGTRGSSGRAAVESTCSWENCLEPLEALLEEAASARRKVEPACGWSAAASTFPRPAGSAAVHGTWTDSTCFAVEVACLNPLPLSLMTVRPRQLGHASTRRSLRTQRSMR